MNFTEIFADVPSLVKGVDSLVLSFETKGNGESKKKAVLDTLEAAYDVANSALGNSIPFKKEDVLRFADSAINTAVAFHNSVGTFEHQVTEDVKHGISSIVSDVKTVVGNVVSDVKEEVQHITHPTT